MDHAIQGGFLSGFSVGNQDGGAVMVTHLVFLGCNWLCQARCWIFFHV